MESEITPLDWHPDPSGDGYEWFAQALAKTVTYKIGTINGERLFYLEFNGHSFGVMNELTTAKLLAQAHFEQMLKKHMRWGRRRVGDE